MFRIRSIRGFSARSRAISSVSETRGSGQCQMPDGTTIDGEEPAARQALFQMQQKGPGS